MPLNFRVEVDIHYFGFDFSDSCPQFYCDLLNLNVLVAVSSNLPQGTIVCLIRVQIKSGISFLKLIKRGVHELWRCYSNNDIIFSPSQSKKRHEKFLVNLHEMNSKGKMQWHPSLLIFLIFKGIYYKNILI